MPVHVTVNGGANPTVLQGKLSIPVVVARKIAGRLPGAVLVGPVAVKLNVPDAVLVQVPVTLPAAVQVWFGALARAAELGIGAGVRVAPPLGILWITRMPSVLGAFDPRALDAYRKSCNEPSRIHAFCEDYRAGAGVDAEQDAADLALHRTLTCPTLIVWSDYLARGGATETPSAVWRRSFAPDIRETRVNTGHFVAEEDPAGVLAALQAFLRS